MFRHDFPMMRAELSAKRLSGSHCELTMMECLYHLLRLASDRVLDPTNQLGRLLMIQGPRWQK